MPTDLASPRKSDQTIYDQITARGVSRREFLQFCAWMGACIGLEASGVEKMVKPDPDIYALALRRFGLKPGEAIFIDDNHDNVVSARANGFAAHHFTDAEKLRRALMDLNLLD